MRRCAVIGAADFELTDGIRDVLQSCEYIMAADCGYVNAIQNGIIPDILVGDFDSLALGAYNVETIRLPVEKDYTDTGFCLKKAKEMGFDEAVLFGATGGKRIDHTFANIALLFWGIDIGIKTYICDKNNLMFALKNDRAAVKKDDKYKYLSIFAWGSESCRVTLEGVKYPLDNFTLSCSFPLGVSNEIISDSAEISVKDGSVLICMSEVV